jgi:hypothetical protein
MSARFRTLGLIFEQSSDGGAGDGLSHGAMARMYLQTYTSGKPNGFREEVHTLTPFEYDADTFDAHADRLIENIVQLKKEARVRFERDRARRKEAKS